MVKDKNNKYKGFERVLSSLLKFSWTLTSLKLVFYFKIFSLKNFLINFFFLFYQFFCFLISSSSSDNLAKFNSYFEFLFGVFEIISFATYFQHKSFNFVCFFYFLYFYSFLSLIHRVISISSKLAEKNLKSYSNLIFKFFISFFIFFFIFIFLFFYFFIFLFFYFKFRRKRQIFEFFQYLPPLLHSIIHH